MKSSTMVFSRTRKPRRQWISQHADYLLRPQHENEIIEDLRTDSHCENNNCYCHHNYSDEYDKTILASCLRPLYKLNRKRALLYTITISLITLNGLQNKLFGIPVRLESFYGKSYELKPKNQQQSLRDRNLSGCDEMTERQRSLRNRKLTGCEKDPYINPEEAWSFLAYMDNRKNNPSDSFNTEGYPSHISLCKELISRNNKAESMENDSTVPSNPFLNKIQTNGVFEVHESEDICTGWERPHSSLMRIISSSIIAYVGSRFNLSYKHGCHSTISSSSDLEFDVTTVQQIFPQNPMPLNENVISLSEIVFDLCQSCIDEHNNLGDNPNDDSTEETYHCFLFPNKGEAHTGYVQNQASGSTTEEVLDEEGHIVNTALEAVLPLVRNRLYHASIDWSPRAHIPSHDPKSGAVIYIDAFQSLPIPFHFFQPRIPLHVTHVSIITSPACVTSKIGSKDCYKYAFQLQQYLQNKYVGIDVSLELMSSTAAAYSRMIQSRTFICPPGTITCLFPALAREVTKESIIFESSNRPSTFHWFNYLAKSKSRSISIIPVSEDEILQVDVEQENIERQFRAIEVSKVLKSEGEKSTPAINASGDRKDTNEDLDRSNMPYVVELPSVPRSEESFDKVMEREKPDSADFTAPLPTKKQDLAEVMFPEYVGVSTSNAGTSGGGKDTIPERSSTSSRFKNAQIFLKDKVMAREKAVSDDSIVPLPTKLSTNTVESQNNQDESIENSFSRYGKDNSSISDTSTNNGVEQYADTAKLFGK